MSSILAGVLSAALATNMPMAVSNVVADRTGLALPVTNPDDPVERAYRKVVEDDDAAEKDILRWSDESAAATRAGTGTTDVTLSSRIRQRLEGVKAEYEDFVAHNPNHVKARLAYGSFLNDVKDEAGAVAQWEKARELAPKNPATWNNLANYYGHEGPAAKAFEYYDKAIELNPNVSVYHHNLAATLYLFRTDAEKYYHLNEQQVFDKALQTYRKAVQLAPDDFVLLTDYAESFYGIKPARWEDGLAAWTQALKAARDENERQGVYIHLARINIKLGNFDEARRDLAAVTGENYTDLKNRINRNLNEAIKTSQTSTPLR